MELTLIDSATDVIGIFFVVLLGAFIGISAGKRFGLTEGRSMLLFAWHTGFAILYAWYVVNNGGDAYGYYNVAKIGMFEFDFGTRGVEYLASIVYAISGLSFLGMSLLFSLAGLVGLIAFDASLQKITEHTDNRFKTLATLIVLLPSVSFWSSGLGKDVFTFMALGLAIWASLNLSSRWLLMAAAVLLMVTVRPHMAGLLIMAIAFAAVFDAHSTIVKRVFLGGLATLVALSLVPFALNYSGVGSDADSKGVIDYIESRQGHNMEGGGGVDIANMSLPMQMFTYVFRPLPFEAHSFAAFMASLDNMLLLYLFAIGLVAKFKGVLPHPSLNTYFIWAYSIGALLILSMTTANLGIAMRQKWMFVPFLMILLLSYVANRSKPMHAELKTPLPLRKPRF